ncbi:hypothetical protein D9757_011874 [Collybiopsis confluens]|uniref:Uncharacterized protein n=1 Tax=Collybiopsis confluens TaxID=2823264 RepID=A0A8H5LRA3_9AGAR|nr:hypothetical protein D9757_011874 [Collybiopsis confluens]
MTGWSTRRSQREHRATPLQDLSGSRTFLGIFVTDNIKRRGKVSVKLGLLRTYYFFDTWDYVY